MEGKESIGIIYDKTPSMAPKDLEGAPFSPEKVQTKEGMVYDKTFQDPPISPEVFQVGVIKQDQRYPSMAPEMDKMSLSSVGNFLQSKFSEALDKGLESYGKTIDHFEKSILEGDIIRNADPDLQTELRGLFAGARGIKSKEELGQFWDKVTDFHSGIEIVKKIKGGK